MLLPLLLSCATDPLPPPNVLIVTLDTTRADHIGAYGQAAATTPTLDGLAADGVRFDRAYTVTPLTIPAHSSLFTGLYPPRHGVRDNGDYFLSDGAHTLAERMSEAGYQTMASVGAEVTSSHWGFAQGFDAFFDDMGVRSSDNRWRVERRGDAVVDDALGWLTARDGTAPWFAWVHLFDVHHPYEPPPPYDQERSPYLGELAFADAQVGRLVAALDARGELDRSWILVMADHGEGLGQHGERMHGVLLYDGTTRIPLIVRPPGGLDQPRTVAAPVSLVDVLPTVLEATGGAAPSDIDGRSLLPDINGQIVPDRAVYAESLYAWRHYGWAPQKALVDDSHKLIDSTTPELYGAGDDRERDDLASSDPNRLATMRDDLRALETRLSPSDATSERATLSEERMAQLEALGYVTDVPATGEPVDGLPDPVTMLPSLARVERARQALQAGQIEEAETALRAVIDADPGLIEPRSMLIGILWRGHKVDEIETLLTEIEALRPGSSSQRMMLAGLRLQQGRIPEASSLFAEAIDIDPYLSRAWGGYLSTLYLLGQLPTLETEVERAEKLLPDAPQIKGMVGLVMALKTEPQARQVMEGVLAEDPHQPFLRFAVAVIAREAGETDVAEALLLDEVALFAPAVPARKLLVEIYAEQRRYAEQLSQLDVIMASGPPTVLDLHARAQALFNLGRYSDAKGAVEVCIAAAPTYPRCPMLQANVLKKLGHEAQAQAAYQRALELAAAPQPGG